MVSRAAGAVAGFSQALPERIGASGSRKGFADALSPGPQEKTPHALVCLEERDAQQRGRAQRLARRHAKTSHWYRSRRASICAHARCGRAAPLGDGIAAESFV